jgi:hypothetical protein
MSTLIDVQGGLTADVVGRVFVPGEGAQVCAETGYSGHFCGTVTDINARLTSMNV